MHELSINRLIQFVDDDGVITIYRVIWRADNGAQVSLFDIQQEDALPELRSSEEIEMALTDGHALMLDSDPYHYLFVARDEDIKPNHRERRDRAYASIENLVKAHLTELFFPDSRGRLIREAATGSKTTKRMILLRLRMYWRQGMVPNALLPLYRKGPQNPGTGNPGQDKPAGEAKRGRHNALSGQPNEQPGINVTRESIGERLYRGYRRFVIIQGMSIPLAYTKTKETLFNQGYALQESRGVGKKPVLVPILPEDDTLPTEDQFEYWGEKLYNEARQQRVQHRTGRRHANERPVRGNSTSNLTGPGAEFQIDATVGDVYLVSSRDRMRIIGRPVIYIVIDTFSRMIVGFAVTLEGPSWLGAMIALETVTMDKVELCRQHGIRIDPWEWPCHHLCHRFLGDRGEMMSKDALAWASRLGITKSIAAPYRADWKGIVERNFGLLNEGLINWLPGVVYDMGRRGGARYRLDARLTLREFRQLLILEILHHNNVHKMKWFVPEPDMIADGVEPNALELWTWGIVHQSGALRTQDQAIVRACLLPRVKASISDRGIYCKGLLYDASDPELNYLYDQAEAHRVPLDAVRDPRTSRYLYIWLPNSLKPVTCELKGESRKYGDADWYEVEDEIQIEAQRQLRTRTEGSEQEALYNAQIKAIIDGADAQMPDTSDLSDQERIGSIRINRQVEREYESQEDAWVPHQPDAPSDTPQDAPGQAEDFDDEAYVPPPNTQQRLLDRSNRKD